MKSAYKAVEVYEPGKLRVVERQVSEPGAGQVRIRVEACGICHTDAATVMGVYPGLTLPRVPGHEVVGRIEGLGAGVSRWKIGQRVGVGLIAGEDGVCESCRRGDPESLPFRMSSHPRKPLLSFARALRPITLFAMRACAVEISSRCRA